MALSLPPLVIFQSLGRPRAPNFRFQKVVYFLGDSTSRTCRGKSRNYWPLGRWLRWLKGQLFFCLSLRCCWCQLLNKHVRPTSWVHDLLDGLPHWRKFFDIIRFMKLLLGKDSSPPCSFGPQRHLVWEANDQLRPCWDELQWAADPFAIS